MLNLFENVVELDAYFLLLSTQVTLHILLMNWILRYSRVLSHTSLLFSISLFDLISASLAMKTFNLAVEVFLHQLFQNCRFLNRHVRNFGLLLAGGFIGLNLLSKNIIGHLFLRLFSLFHNFSQFLLLLFVGLAIVFDGEVIHEC